MSTDNKSSSEVISPIALGLISDPPTIVLTYDYQKVTGKFGERWKRRKRKMPLRDFTDKTNVKRYVFNLRQRHVKYLANVIDVTLEKMLRTIQEVQKGNSVERSLTIVEKEYSVDPNEDLNKLTPAQLAQRKAVMDEMFRKNLIKPGDPGFVYDKEVDFDEKKAQKGNDWDDEENSDKSLKPVKSEECKKTTVELTEIDSIENTNNDDNFDLQPLPVGDESKIEEEKSQVLEEIKPFESIVEEHVLSISHKESAFTRTPPPEEKVPNVREVQSDASEGNLGEVLENIETIAIDDEDEDFWK